MVLKSMNQPLFGALPLKRNSQTAEQEGKQPIIDQDQFLPLKFRSIESVLTATTDTSREYTSKLMIQ